MSSSQPVNSTAPFLPTSIYFPEEFSEFRVVLLAIYRNISNTVNVREIAVFDLSEFLTGQQWFTIGNPQTKRQTYRKVFSIGAIATGATANTAHGIAGQTAFTKISGTCVTDVIDYKPIPYASATVVTDQVEIKVNSTNIVIINGATAPNITSAIVVLEYLKN